MLIKITFIVFLFLLSTQAYSQHPVSEAEYNTAVEIRTILLKYVNLENEFFKGSKKEFESGGKSYIVDYEKINKHLNILSQQLENIIKNIKPDNNVKKILLDYSRSLNECIESLRYVSKRLQLLANNQLEYNFKNYNSDIDNFYDKKDRYIELGKELSEYMFGKKE